MTHPLSDRSKPLLKAENLALTRGDLLLFENISLEVRPGDMLWIKGRNGSGKTSFLKCLAALLAPETGTIKRNGIPAFLGHKNSHKPNLSVRKNLEFWQSIYDTDNDLVKICGRLGIEDLLSQRAQTLSAGQSRRVALARLLLADAKVWLLDEPTTPLDSVGRNLVYELVEEHLKNGGAAMLASHDTPQHIGIRTRIITLSRGGHGNN